jgi:hypothetical protein
MSDSTRLAERVASLEQEVAQLRGLGRRRGVRRQSFRTLYGLPLWDIALGPDPDRNEVRGHARGIVAIGDIATGIVALGGIARGVVAIGGVALGVLCFGGLSLGILVSLGGLAVGCLAGAGGLAVGVIAIGGGAVGVVAIGGGAFGYYALGGNAAGEYVVDGMRRDPQAMQFFRDWVPGMGRLFDFLNM